MTDPAERQRAVRAAIAGEGLKFPPVDHNGLVVQGFFTTGPLLYGDPPGEESPTQAALQRGEVVQAEEFLDTSPRVPKPDPSQGTKGPQPDSIDQDIEDAIARGNHDEAIRLQMIRARRNVATA